MARSIDDVDHLNEKLLCLFKGDPGTAKSPAAGSFPEPYFFDVDGRYPSIVNYWKGKKKIAFDTYVNDYPGIMEKLESLITYNPYGTIVLDGITTLARSLHSLSFKSRGLTKSDEGRRGGRNKEERVYVNQGVVSGFKGIPKLEIDDYMTENNGIIQVLDALRGDLWKDGKGCHIVVIAHVIEKTNALSKTTTRTIMTGGKAIAAEIPVYFNEAYHFAVDAMEVGNRRYLVYTRNEGDDWAKTSLPIPDKIDFTNRSLYDDIQWFVNKSKEDVSGPNANDNPAA